VGKVIAGFSMSLDGFIAAPDDTVPHIFDWYESGTGSGIPFFANLTTTPVLFDDPTVIEDDRVTHLVDTVRP
jgi:hypothetical protein